MRERRTARVGGRVAVAAAVVGAGAIVAAPPASAAYTATVNGTELTVTLSSADSVTITCVSNQVRVNGSNVGITCSTLTDLDVTGSGGADTINASGVTSASFTTLDHASFDGGAGGDTITVGGFASGAGPFMIVHGEDGDDHLVGTNGKAGLYGGPGDDTIEAGNYGATIDAGPGRDIVHGGPGGDKVFAYAAELPDAEVTGGGGGDGFVVEGAERVWMRGSDPKGCEMVVSTPTKVEVLNVDPTFEACSLQATDGETRRAVVAGLSPQTFFDVVMRHEHLELDLYTGGPTIEDPVAKSYTRAGYGSVYYKEFLGGTVSRTLHETYGTDTQRWVHSAARDLADTQLSDGDISSIAAPIAAGNRTKASYTKELTDSAAWRGLQVDRIFQTFLHRLPDPSGRAYWIGRIGGGTKVRVVRAGFMASPEYYEDSGGTATAYVAQVYRDVLGRDPEPGGLSYWVNRLNSGDPRSAVATALIVSAETEQKEVVRQYRYYLGRDPVTAVRDSWVPKIRDLSDGEQQLHGYLVATAEYEGRAS